MPDYMVHIVFSTFHGNTEKVAHEMATVLNAQLVNLNEADTPALADYDLIGLGSGIYWVEHDLACAAHNLKILWNTVERNVTVIGKIRFSCKFGI